MTDILVDPVRSRLYGTHGANLHGRSDPNREQTKLYSAAPNGDAFGALATLVSQAWSQLVKGHEASTTEGRVFFGAVTADVHKRFADKVDVATTVATTVAEMELAKLGAKMTATRDERLAGKSLVGIEDLVSRRRDLRALVLNHKDPAHFVREAITRGDDLELLAAIASIPRAMRGGLLPSVLDEAAVKSWQIAADGADLSAHTALSADLVDYAGDAAEAKAFIALVPQFNTSNFIEVRQKAGFAQTRDAIVAANLSPFASKEQLAEAHKAAAERENTARRERDDASLANLRATIGA